ncbi:hypothetical protein CYLTODRAFT_456404 [Cylindrobasidium torrendii FP15055 ss-10]|uniref:Uncharacterized protein n=1 Tax=Cylindrobasidium torrendii FP15055 ss-10 TaxID=1314674 RepID=A0A0D7B4D4_9AGAR|nr:hypothetical protein CYLTODRAFT_456404 [Cylindrobasidium torrendii FP15055 ss-10]
MAVIKNSSVSARNTRKQKSFQPISSGSLLRTCYRRYLLNAPRNSIKHEVLAFQRILNRVEAAFVQTHRRVNAPEIIPHSVVVCLAHGHKKHYTIKGCNNFLEPESEETNLQNESRLFTIWLEAGENFFVQVNIASFLCAVIVATYIILSLSTVHVVS